MENKKRGGEVADWLSAARRALNDGRITEARDLLAQVEDADPGNQDALDILWRIEDQEIGDEGVAGRSPSDQRIDEIEARVRRLLEQHRIDDARWALEQAMAVVDDTASLDGIALLVQAAENRDERLRQQAEQAHRWLEEGQDEAARKLAEGLREEAPEHPEVRNLVSRCDEPPSKAKPKPAEPRGKSEAEAEPGLVALASGRTTDTGSHRDTEAEAARDPSQSHAQTRAQDQAPEYLDRPPPDQPPLPENDATNESLVGSGTWSELGESESVSEIGSPSGELSVVGLVLEVDPAAEGGRSSRGPAVSAVLAALALVGLASWIALHRESHRTTPVTIDRVRVEPVGPQRFGCRDGDQFCADDESPPVVVEATAAFDLATTEVSRADYDRCVGAGVCAGDVREHVSDASLPATYVTWADAQTFCHWVGGRLPTEAEWELAASPTGDELEVPAKANRGAAICCGEDASDGWPRGGPVGAVGVNSRGFIGLAGNVAEWTSSPYAESLVQISAVADAIDSAELVTVRGGSFLHPPEMLRPTARQAMPAGIRSAIIGFRCAW